VVELQPAAAALKSENPRQTAFLYLPETPRDDYDTRVPLVSSKKRCRRRRRRRTPTEHND